MLQQYDGIEAGIIEGKSPPIGLVDGKWGMEKIDGLTRMPKNVTVRLRRAGGGDMI